MRKLSQQGQELPTVSLASKCRSQDPSWNLLDFEPYPEFEKGDLGQEQAREDFMGKPGKDLTGRKTGRPVSTEEWVQWGRRGQQRGQEVCF